MTHDELLSKIDEEGEFLVQHFDAKAKVHSALRSVVELHKEVILITGYSHDKTYELRQQVCVNCTDLAGKPIPYPCFNVQAIEKELK